MHKDRQTLAVYGIQDRENYEYPFYVHDHNLALTGNGKISGFLQLERKTREKRDNSLHLHLKDILREKKLIPCDYDLIFIDNTVGRAFITRNGDARFEAPLNQSLKTTTEKGKCWWFGEEREAWVINHELHIFAHVCHFLEFLRKTVSLSTSTEVPV
jgi:carbamoyltransferase